MVKSRDDGGGGESKEKMTDRFVIGTHRGREWRKEVVCYGACKQKRPD